MDKFSHIESDPYVAVELNAAFLCSISSETINHYAGLFIDSTRIQMIIKNNFSPQTRRYYNPHHIVRPYNALDESFSAQLSTGEKIECRYIQMTPISGQIQARALIHQEKYFLPLPIPQENFFILRNFHEKFSSLNPIAKSK